jgi:reactive intermediate/imine deaminase
METKRSRLEPLQVDAMPPPRGLYSRGIRVEGGQSLLFVSGQAAVDSEGRLVGEGDPGRQMRQTLENLKMVLAAGGATLSDVAKLTIYVTDIADVSTISGVRGEFFAPPYPASTLVEVSAFTVRGMLVEIDAIAVAGSDA